MASISGQPGNSMQVYHYPPIFQDNPNGNCLTGPIKENQPYEVVGQFVDNKDSLFVRDVAYPKLLWARYDEGVLVKNSDGELVYVPPRPTFTKDQTDPKATNSPNLKSALANLPPNHLHNPCPSGMPNNPYSLRTTRDHQLMNVINNWWRQRRNRPTHNEYVKKFRESWIPLFSTLGPSPEKMVSIRKKIADIGKIDYVTKILQNTNLSPSNLSSEQLLKLGNMRVCVDQIMNIIDQYELWDEFPLAGSIDQIYDQQITKSPRFFKKLIKELSNLSASLPDGDKKRVLQEKEQAILDGWNCLENRDEHLQALADVIFDSNLQIQTLPDWEERIDHLKELLSDNIREIGKHVPTSGGDLIKIPHRAFLGFLDGIVNFSNDPIYSPVFGLIKKYAIGELYPLALNPEDSKSWTYLNIRDTTQFALDCLMWSTGATLLKFSAPAIKYAWANKSVLTAALGSETLGKEFLTKCGLLNPVTNELKFTVKDLVNLSEVRSPCLHDAMIALNSNSKRGYKACIEAYSGRMEVRKYCVENGFTAAKTAEIMSHKNLRMEIHHIFSPSNTQKGWTRRFNDIAKKYGLDLEGEWNKIRIPHKGRHPDQYHRFVHDKLIRIDKAAAGNKEIFLELIEKDLKGVIKENSLIIRGIGI